MLQQYHQVSTASRVELHYGTVHCPADSARAYCSAAFSIHYPMGALPCIAYMKAAYAACLAQPALHSLASIHLLFPRLTQSMRPRLHVYYVADSCGLSVSTVLLLLRCFAVLMVFLIVHHCRVVLSSLDDDDELTRGGPPFSRVTHLRPA